MRLYNFFKTPYEYLKHNAVKSFYLPNSCLKSFHQPDKFVEQVAAVVRAGRAFRVILH